MRQMLTLIRRELIEHRSSWIATSVFGALFVLGAHRWRCSASCASASAARRHDTFEDRSAARSIPSMLRDRPSRFMRVMSIAMVLYVVMTFVVFFYLLDALYTERKDRSILFWKSLPVSDMRVVASKYLTGIVAIPLIAVAVFMATAVLVMLVGGIGLAVTGYGPLMGLNGNWLAEAPGALLHVTLMFLYTLAFQALWYAPVDGWLLLVSAFAKRGVLGWAVLPPALVVVGERLLLGSRYVLDLIAHRLAGGFDLAFRGDGQGVLINSGDMVVSSFPTLGDIATPGRLLAAPSLWMGIAVGVVLLAGAVWLRRWRDDA
jgi:ABC-2 type transport system permease protein